MKYGESLRGGWVGVGSAGAWGFLATAYVVFAVISFVLAAVFVGIVGLDALSTLPDALGGATFDPSALPPSLPTAALITWVLALVLLLPVGVASNAGLIHLSNELAQGRKARVGDGWKAGFKSWGSVFFVDFVVWLIELGVGILAMMLLGLIVAGSIGASGASGASPSDALGRGFVGVCFGGAVAYVVVIAVGLLLQAWEAMSARRVVIEHSRGPEALGRGFELVRQNFGTVLLLLITLFAIALGVIVVFQMVAAPFTRLQGSSSQSAALFGSFGGLAIALVNMVISAGISLFTYSVWTTFYRGAAGLAAPPAALGVAGYAPAASPEGPAYMPPPPPPTPVDSTPTAPSAGFTPSPATPTPKPPEAPEPPQAPEPPTDA